MTNPEDRMLGRLFDGRYRILRKLGSGGMASVYLAEDEELGRKVALKMLDDRHARDAQFVERFKREARNAASLNHPRIVRIYDRGQAEGTYYIAMEYLDGPTLKEMLIRKGPTPPMTAVKFAREILSALGEAHRNQIVHRDIKPHNVLVGPGWNLKVTDFGIARSGASEMTETGSIVGTAQYLSPEQARGTPVDQRSDLYSLGIVLYELLTGSVPFQGGAAVEIAMKHLSEIPAPPSTIRPEISSALDAVVMRALAKDPNDRYASAEEMDADLARVARGAPVAPQTEEAMTQILSGAGGIGEQTMVTQPLRPVPPPAPPAYRPPSFYDEKRRRKTFWPYLLGLSAIAIAAIGGWLVYSKVSSTIDTGKTIAVQDVRRLTSKNAKLLLENQGLQVRFQTIPSNQVSKGVVIDQDPLPGDRVAAKTTVTLIVSDGLPKTAVPTLKDLPIATALSLLQNAHLKWKIVKIHSQGVPAGTVMATKPAAGATVLQGSVVTLNVSQGPREVAVPSVVGSPWANADSAIRGAGLVPVRVDASSSAPEGEVTGTSPSAGTVVATGSSVTVTVSTGPKIVTVPDLTQSNRDAAITALEDLGLSPSVIDQDVTDPALDGVVMRQTPHGGTLEAGSTVTLYVGHLIVETTTTPTTTTPTTTTPTTTTTTTTTTAPTTPTTPTTTTPTTTVATIPATTTAASTASAVH